MKQSFLLLLMAAAAVVGACNNGSDTADLGYDPDAQQLQIGKDIAAVQTTYGTVKGFIYQNVNTFLGIPYGDDTSGENRFMPPKPRNPGRASCPRSGIRPRLRSAPTPKAPHRMPSSVTAGTTTASAKTASSSTSGPRDLMPPSGRSSCGCTAADSPPATA